MFLSKAEMSNEEKEVKLTWKQKAFIQEYLLDFNATQAAIRVGYSEKTARQMASENLSKPYIQAEIKRQLDERALTVEEALDIITQHAKGDIGDFMAVSGVGFNLDLQEAFEQGKTRVIKKVRQKTTIFSGKTEEEDREVHEIEIELYDAQAAADKILRVHGRYKNPETDLGQITLKIVREGDAGTDDNPEKST